MNTNSIKKLAGVDVEDVEDGQDVPNWEQLFDGQDEPNSEQLLLENKIKEHEEGKLSDEDLIKWMNKVFNINFNSAR